MKRPRRELDVFSLSFLDCICCGFGAIILLLTLTRLSEPKAIENAQKDLKGLLALVHVLAVVFQVEGLYATRLGEWSSAHYGAFARNFWAGGFHFYLVAVRFAAPFALWWALGRNEEKVEGRESRA